jgi:hypothetical protein
MVRSGYYINWQLSAACLLLITTLTFHIVTRYGNIAEGAFQVKSLGTLSKILVSERVPAFYPSPGT